MQTSKEISVNNALKFYIKNLFLIGVFTKRLREYLDAEEKAILRSAVAETINRNYAHHIGSHVSPRATIDKVLRRIGKNIKDLSNNRLAITIAQMLNNLEKYKDERNEFIANLTNAPCYQPFYLFKDVLLPFIENTLLMDNIAANEGIDYKNNDRISVASNQGGREILNLNNTANQLVIRVFIHKSLCKQQKQYCVEANYQRLNLTKVPDDFLELKAYYFGNNDGSSPCYDSLALPYYRELIIKEETDSPSAVHESFFEMRIPSCR